MAKFSESRAELSRVSKMTKYFQLDWKRPVPEALQLGTMFDRWTEVGNFHKLKGAQLSSCLRGRFKEKINYYQNTRDLSLT